MIQSLSWGPSIRIGNERGREELTARGIRLPNAEHPSARGAELAEVQGARVESALNLLEREAARWGRLTTLDPITTADGPLRCPP
jgi:hypothetical protein